MDELEARTICVDIDHTLCKSEGPGTYADAMCLPGAQQALSRLREDGWIVVLLTARHFNTWKVTVDWLARHGFEYDQLVFGKPPARFYIDDRGIEFDGDWDALPERITGLAADPTRASD